MYVVDFAIIMLFARVFKINRFSFNVSRENNLSEKQQK